MEILKNPKYTGYQVYNRRARRSRGGRNRCNPPEMWVWSVEAAHEPLIPKWLFDAIQTMGEEKQGSRDGAGLKKDPRAKRTYRFRGRVRCDCGRRMIGNPRHNTTYYRCHPENNNRGRPDKYAGHPATIYMREDLIMTEVSKFFAERVFGPGRRELFLSDLDEVDDSARRKREEQRQRLQRKLADIARNKTTSCAKPRTPILQTPSCKACGSATTTWPPNDKPCSPRSRSWTARTLPSPSGRAPNNSISSTRFRTSPSTCIERPPSYSTACSS
ncbi:MAG: recombinase family protein [Actinomycetota bacterium]|nr:recombinase family protein [Actinomycetota bacterium]